MPTLECNIVEVCAFSFPDNIPVYLLLRRSKADKIYPDTWQIVSGSVEAGETTVKASLRELKEETGLVPEKFWLVPHTNTFLNPERDVVHISAVFAAQVAAGSRPRLSKEHYEFEWCSLAGAMKLLVWPGQVEALRIVHDYIVQGKPPSVLTEIPREKW